ncbi:MAG: efflux RND transporter permease subunit, partial [Henriciella sp.]|nr:efflux RND transporter permease subunit [Henriciella sp.]
DINDSDIGSYVETAKRIVDESIKLPAGYSLAWSGQYEYMQRAKERFSILGPVMIMIIFVLLFLNFRNLSDVMIIMGTLPFALVGGLWLMYAGGYNLSVAAVVGFIALAGVAVEVGVLMIMYLNLETGEARAAAAKAGQRFDREQLVEAVKTGVLRRLRPIIMTSATILAGLAPIMYGDGTGSEVMRRIAAPMVGGIISATFLALIVIPALYLLWHGRSAPRRSELEAAGHAVQSEHKHA